MTWNLQQYVSESPKGCHKCMVQKLERPVFSKLKEVSSLLNFTLQGEDITSLRKNGP